ncbi:MAG TPA: hypothetical protein VMX76_00050 [Nevskiaceae bacterium]|nr:hypothetical protein [Nevskiaceae bacterium]
MKNSEQSKNYKSLLWPGIIFLVVAIIGLAFLKPKITGIFQLRKQIAKDKNTLAQLTQKINALEGLDEKELEIKIEKVLKALPSEKNIAGLLYTLKILSQETEVGLKDIQVSPGELSTRSAQPETKSESGLPLLSFSLIVEGESEKARNFFDRIETIMPLMKIRGIGMAQSDEGVVEANLELATFFLLLPKELGVIENPLALITLQEEKAYQELTRFKAAEKVEEWLLIPSGKENPFIF